MDAKEVAFKAFKVAYDRESGYVGYKVSGEEFKVDCTKFDKLHPRVQRRPLQGRRTAGETVCRPGPGLLRTAGARPRFHLAYTNREATYLKRFTFGGTILNKIYHCIPPKSKVLFFEAEHPPSFSSTTSPRRIRRSISRPAIPSQVEVKGPKTRGRQISIKDVSSINSKPPRGWDPEGANDEAAVYLIR